MWPLVEAEITCCQWVVSYRDVRAYSMWNEHTVSYYGIKWEPTTSQPPIWAHKPPLPNIKWVLLNYIDLLRLSAIFFLDSRTLLKSVQIQQILRCNDWTNISNSLTITQSFSSRWKQYMQSCQFIRYTCNLLQYNKTAIIHLLFKKGVTVVYPCTTSL